MKPIVFCAVLLATTRFALAGCPCDHCGCQSSCRKVCRVICEVKKVPKITYDCECEEFCVPGKSCRTKVCDECGHKKTVYTPTCGEVRMRTKLVRKETVEEKVTYRWVVECVCDGCASRCAAQEAPTPGAGEADDAPSAPVPPPQASYYAPAPPTEARQPLPGDSPVAAAPRKTDLREILPLFGRR